MFWKPSLSYTIISAFISGIVGAMFVCVFAAFISFFEIPASDTFFKTSYIVSTIIIWLVLICMPEDSEL